MGKNTAVCAELPLGWMSSVNKNVYTTATCILPPHSPGNVYLQAENMGFSLARKNICLIDFHQSKNIRVKP